MAYPEALIAHLESGTTTLCRAWQVVRQDGTSYGFTDHDTDLTFDGVTFKADTGLTANALEQSTGLSVDNTEALGALSSVAVTEDDIRAGRFDGAEVQSWLVNWTDVAQRVLLFKGTFGELVRVAGGFRAELRGLTEALNQSQGRVYHSVCSEVLGGKGCQFNILQPGFYTEVEVEAVEKGKVFTFANLTGFDDRWFERGRLTVLTGAGAGLIGLVKNDRLSAAKRVIELWEDLRADLAVGDTIRIETGCDKRAETCRLKFDNFINFRGFPHIPGDDWLTSYPVSSADNDGGSLLGSGSQSDEVTNPFIGLQ